MVVASSSARGQASILNPRGQASILIPWEYCSPPTMWTQNNSNCSSSPHHHILVDTSSRRILPHERASQHPEKQKTHNILNPKLQANNLKPTPQEFRQAPEHRTCPIRSEVTQRARTSVPNLGSNPQLDQKSSEFQFSTEAETLYLTTEDQSRNRN